MQSHGAVRVGATRMFDLRVRSGQGLQSHVSRWRHALGAAVVAAVLLWPAAMAVAQPGGGFSPFGNLAKAYQPPSNPKFASIHKRLSQRQVLEQLREFLRPLRLAKPLEAIATQCGSPTRPYKLGQPITICYELVEQIDELAKKAFPNNATEQNLMVYGAVIQAVLHQTAMAVFENLQVPVWGREEDAADRLAALIMVEFGEDMARTAILGTINLFVVSHATGRAWTGSDFASAASPAAQRYYTYLCMAYAADPSPLGPSLREITQKRLPEVRRRWCEQHYRQVRRAFYLAIMPHIDPEALIKVRATQWLNWKPSK